MIELPEIVQFSFPTSIGFGVGVRRHIPGALQQTGCSKPLLVTDSTLAQLAVVRDLVVLLEDSGLQPTVFSEIAGNPVESQVTAGVEAFKSSGSDCLLAVGGGAPIDVAKAITLMVHHPGDLFDYEDGREDGRPVDKELPCLVAVPTTAGTGSEVGRSAVISEDDTHIKRIIFSPRLLPAHVFCDPEMTLQLPPKITAATGMDALSHLVESYIAIGFHPMCDGIALQGIRMVADNLHKCVDFATLGDEVDIDGEAGIAAHVDARGNMLLAALMGAVAFQKGLGATHSCAHALSTVCDLHHGLVNGIMLPYTMAFNQSAVPQRFEEMAHAAGQDSAGFVKWIEHLQAEIDIPEYLSTVGVTEDHIDDLVEVALVDPCHLLNPRPVSREDFQTLFMAALEE